MQFIDGRFSAARRRFFRAGLAIGLASMHVPFVLAVPARASDFGVFETPSLQILLQAVRTLFPHVAIGDAPYFECVRAIDARAQQDADFRQLITAGLARLPTDFAVLDSAACTKVLGQEEGTPFFKALRTAASGLYRNPAVWPHFGYPGPSLGFGGYVDRPQLDLSWLETAAQ